MQKQLMFRDKEKVHLIGIGGIGMSGIAQILMAQGLRVSGSDLKPSKLIEKLRSLGAQIFIGHSASNVRDVDLVVYSSAIKQANPELLAAYARNIPVLSRAEALAGLANQKKSIAIAGAHGKTTTASLISHMLVKCGLEPTICIGGELFSLNGNAFLGEGHYFVLEADESDGSFLNLNPLYSIITNIDREHLDYYKDLDGIKDAFRKFIGNIKNEGCIFFCQDDSALTEIVRSSGQRCLGYGLSTQAQVYAKDIKLQSELMSFNCIYKGRILGEMSLRIPGRHNICNLLAVVAFGLEINLDFNSIKEALSSYRGVRRRLQLKLKRKDVLIFDDYAHHPTEIKATLEALRSFRHKRILTVFQPHRYTRTKSLIEDFGSCFRGTDNLIVTDIYPASESPIEGVTAENICRKAREAKVKKVLFLPKEEIVEHLLRETRPGDLIAIMGAGDIEKIADALAEEFKNQSPL